MILWVNDYSSPEGRDYKQLRCLKLLSAWNIRCLYLVQTSKMINNSTRVWVLLIPIKFIHQNAEQVLVSEHLWYKYVEGCIQSKLSAHKHGWHQLRYGSCTILCQRPIMEQWISATDSRSAASVQTILSTLLYSLLQTNRPPLLPALFSLLCSLSEMKVYKIHMYIISPIQSCHLQP